MATVILGCWYFSAAAGSTIHQCEIEARNGEDALVMEAHERGLKGARGSAVTAYFRFEDSQRGILLYDDEGFDSLDDAKEALTEWYANHAPTLLITLAA